MPFHSYNSTRYQHSCLFCVLKKKTCALKEEIDGCRDAFLAFDKDRSGTIDV